jgi:hypothetical protein
MHTEVEKLIIRAKKNGFITERQQDLIISKAKELGDDIGEIEFSLEDIPIKSSEIHDNTTNEQSTTESIILDDVVEGTPVSHNNSLTVATESLKGLKRLNNKGCKKGCLWLIVIMAVLGILGYIYDLILG